MHDIKEGDVVQINLTRFKVMNHRHDGTLIQDNVEKDNATIDFNVQTIELDGKTCFMIQDRDVDFVVEEYEDEPEAKIVIPKNKIVVL